MTRLDPAYAPHRARVLDLLRSRGARGVTTAEISSPRIGGLEGARRLRELRQMGHEILSEPLQNGLWRYWLRQPGEQVVEQSDLFSDDWS